LLYKFFNKHAYITTLSSMLLCIPCFIFEKPELSLAYSIAIVGYWMGDTGTMKLQRQKYWLLLNIYLLFCSGLIAIAGESTPLLTIFLGLIGFIFTGISAFGARSGTLGYGCLFLMTSVLLLMESGQSVWEATINLMIGGLSYHICQTLADIFLPHQSEREVLQRAYATLGRKIKLHAHPLNNPISQEKQFVQTAKLRSDILDDLKLLENKLRYKHHEGILKPRHAKLFHKLYTLKHITRRSRLLTFVPTEEFKQACAHWLQEIAQASTDVAHLIQNKPGVKPDFEALINYQVPSQHAQEAQRAQEFIHHLQWILTQHEQNQDIKATPTDTAQDKSDSDRINKYLETLRLHADWKSMTFRHALRVGLCMSLGFMITDYFNLHSYAWTLMTIILVLRAQLSMTWKRFRERLFGTVLGLLSFMVFLWIEPSKLQCMILFFIATFGFYQFAIKNYGFAVCFITLMIFSGYMIMGAEENLFLLRSENTLLGIVLPILFMILIRQPRQFHSFHEQFDHTIESYKRFIQGLLTRQNDDALCEQLYLAVQKDAQLFNSWQLLLMEPKHHVKKAQDMLNFSMHSNQLLRELTSIQQQDDHNMNALKKCLEILERLQQELKKKPIFDISPHIIRHFKSMHLYIQQ